MNANVLPTILFKAGAIEMIDQTLLPAEYKILRLEHIDGLCEAIKSLRIRGAPALGVAGGSHISSILMQQDSMVLAGVAGLRRQTLDGQLQTIRYEGGN